MCFFFCFLAYFWLVSKELTEPRRCNWGRQLQVLEHVEVFQTVILLSIFFFGLECSFFRTANTMYFLCSQCAEQGDSLPEQANYLPLHPLWVFCWEKELHSFLCPVLSQWGRGSVFWTRNRRNCRLWEPEQVLSRKFHTRLAPAFLGIKVFRLDGWKNQ